MKPTHLIVFALVLAAAVAATALWLVEDPAVQSASFEEVADRAADRGAAELTLPEPATDAPAAPPTPLEVDPRPDDVAARVAAPGSERSALAVRVLHRESRQPVAGAQVWFAPVTALPEGAPRRLHTLQSELEEHGSFVTCDAAGDGRIPRPSEEQQLVVTAVAEGLWAHTTVGSESEAVALEMIAERTLRVRVVDLDGRPLEGVPVGLRYLSGDWSLVPFVTATLGPEGLAVFPHVAHCFEWVRQPGVNWVVDLLAVAEEPVQFDFPDDALPEEAITLVMPDTSRVVVTARFPDGTPFLGSGHVEVGVVGADEEREQSPFGSERRRIEGEFVEGRATFDHVAPCDELEVVLTRGQSLIQSRSYVRGPGAPGQLHPVEVVIGSEHPVLRFRALDASRTPIASARLAVDSTQTGSFGRRVWSSEAETDSAGLFSVDSRADHTATTLFVRMEPSAPDAAPLTAEVQVPLGLEPGVHDLGDVVLAEQPPFVAGTVVTPGGQAVPKAALYLRRQEATPEGLQWRTVSPFTQEARDGAFAVRGSFDGELFQIGVLDPQCYSEPVEFRPGTTGLVLHAGAPGWIHGSLLVDEGTPTDLLDIELHWRGSGRQPPGLPPWGARATLRADGEFRTHPLPPGPYEVRITVDRGEVLFVAEDVLAAPGEPTLDPRLQGIDLRGVLHAFEVRLSPDDDAPSLDGFIVLTDPAAEEPEEHWINVDGRTTPILTAARPVNLSISVAGYRSVELERVEGDQEVRLEKGPEGPSRVDGHGPGAGAAGLPQGGPRRRGRVRGHRLGRPRLRRESRDDHARQGSGATPGPVDRRAALGGRCQRDHVRARRTAGGRGPGRRGGAGGRDRAVGRAAGRAARPDPSPVAATPHRAARAGRAASGLRRPRTRPGARAGVRPRRPHRRSATSASGSARCRASDSRRRSRGPSC